MKIDYPINGTDVNLYITGEVVGQSREEHDLFLHEIIAKLNNTEVFRYEGGDEHGLLKYTDISEDIIQMSESLLVEEKFRSHE